MGRCLLTCHVFSDLLLERLSFLSCSAYLMRAPVRCFKAGTLFIVEEAASHFKKEQMANIFFGGSVLRSGVFDVGWNLPGLAALEALTFQSLLPLRWFCPSTTTLLSGHSPNRGCRSSFGIQGLRFVRYRFLRVEVRILEGPSRHRLQ